MMHDEQVYTFLHTLEKFQYEISCRDHIWKVIFQDGKKKWHYIHITKYKEEYYLALVNGTIDILEVKPHENSIKAAEPFFRSSFNPYQEPSNVWSPLLLSAHQWLKRAERNWVLMNKQVRENYPLNYQYGILPAVIARSSLKDMYRVDSALGAKKTDQFVKLVDEGYFLNDKNLTRESMTLNDYFDYCRIAYIAAEEKKGEVDKTLSGREMYERYADGRDNGLLSIQPDSEKEFSDWIDGKHPNKTIGGHPFEIKRGGNTTHIDLYVTRPHFDAKESFTVTINGPSRTRLKEAVCMFLAIQKAGLPITISDPEGIRRRLLSQDNIGIVPTYNSLHRANQRFQKLDHVYDVMHFDDLGRYKTRAKHFITWEPLPMLIPMLWG
jgi:hypothetical protein